MNLENNNSQPCNFFEFGLFVTGETEEEHLPSLLKNLINLGICKVIVKERIPQLSPITSKKRLGKIAGSNNKITTKEEDKIVFPARKYLSENPCRYLLLIDDLENDRASQSQQVFERYRNALDTCLSQEQKIGLQFIF